MPMTKPGKFDSKGAWDGFRGEIWQEEINVRDFIQKNYTPYDGDESFLAGSTERTEKLWNHVQKLQKEERERQAKHSSKKEEKRCVCVSASVFVCG